METIRVAVDAVGIRDGGGASLICELIKWLPKVESNWQWTVYLLNEENRLFSIPSSVKRVKVVTTAIGNSWFGRLLWLNIALPRRLKRERIDVLLSFANLPPLHSSLPTVLFVQQLKAIVDDHGETFLQRLRLRLMRYMILMGASSIDTVIVQTSQMREHLVALRSSLASKIHVIPSGVRTMTSTPDVRSFVANAVQDTTVPRLVYISLPRTHKNHMKLLQVFRIILDTMPTTSLLLTIPGPENNIRDKFTRLIHSQAALLDLNENIVWLDKITADEVYFVLENSTAMVFPSLKESFGLPIIEAFAAGCPSIISDLPYAREVAGKAAEYFDPYNPKDIARSLKNVLCSEEILSRLRREGQHRVTRYQYPNLARKFSEILTTAVQ